MLKYLLILLLSLLATTISAQGFSFSRDFVPGTIILKDSSQKTGMIKWFPAQEEKLIYREKDNAPKQKFAPEELLGFLVDSFTFVAVSGFDVYANDFALLGKTSKIRHTFGQRLGKGKINSYLVFYSGYNAFAGVAQTYTNFLFEKTTDSGSQYAAFPVGIRMRDKRFETAKQNLAAFFMEYPEIADKIKSLKQQDDFFEVINLVKKLN